MRLNEKRNQLAIACLTVISLITGLGVYASSSITFNSGNDVSLGAGNQRVTTCDNDVFIDPPGLTFDTATQKYMISTISVSQVSQKNPTGCGNWILELAAGYQGGYQMTSWSIPSSSVDSTFYFGGSNSGTGMAKGVLSPIDPTQIQNIAIQMYPAKNCADGGTCGLGDAGPGGGIVVYVAPTTFTEPISGKTYKYIEAAPAYWIPSVVDPQVSVCTSTSDLSGTALSENIGYAKSNTDFLIGTSTCRGTSISASTTPSGSLRAAALVRNYGSDWNLPTYRELIEMCKVARFGAAIAPTKANCNDPGGNSAPPGWSAKNYASSSKTTTAGQIDVVNFASGTINNSSAAIDQSYPIRAIRYF